MSGTKSLDDCALELHGVWPLGSIDGSAQWSQANGTLLLNLTRCKPHLARRETRHQSNVSLARWILKWLGYLFF